MANVIYNKFLVLKYEDIEMYLNEQEKFQLKQIGSKIYKARVSEGKTGDNSYYVVNQDEPYAEVVLKEILKGEDNK